MSKITENLQILIWSSAYIISDFVISLILFVIAVGFIGVGLSTIIIWIGLPILFSTCRFLERMRINDMKMAAEMLEMDMLIESGNENRKVFSLRTVGDALNNLVYRIKKFIASTISFSITIVLIAANIVFLLAPFLYLLNIPVPIYFFQYSAVNSLLSAMITFFVGIGITPISLKTIPSMARSQGILSNKSIRF